MQVDDAALQAGLLSATRRSAAIFGPDAEGVQIPEVTLRVITDLLTARELRTNSEHLHRAYVTTFVELAVTAYIARTLRDEPLADDPMPAYLALADVLDWLFNDWLDPEE